MHQYLARVERHITGDVTLHVLKDDDMVQVRDGDEFLTIVTKVEVFDA